MKSTRPAIGVALAWLVSLGTVLAAAPPPPIAVVTDLQGDVTLQRAGEPRAALLDHTAFLRPGDRLQTGHSGHATLFQRRASVVTLGPDRTVLLRPQDSAARAGVLADDLFALIEKHAATAAQSGEAKSAEV